MESSYGIGVKNRYAVFIGDEEDDPLTIVAKSEEKLKTTTAATDKHSSANRSVKALNDSKTNHQNIISKDKTQKDSLIKSKTTEGLQSLSKNKDITKGDSNRINRQKTDRNQRPRDVNQTGDKPNHINDRQNRPPRAFNNDQKDIDDQKNQRNRDERFGGNTNEIRRERSDSDRRGGRGGRSSGPRTGGRGGGRFGDDQRRGKRDLDRHSGSDKAGVKAVDKRDGGGAHNWGKIDDFSTREELNADNQDMADKSADETTLEVNDSNVENDGNPNDESVPKEEAPKEMTLEEYKQQLEEQREEDPRKGRHKQILDIEINFSRDEGRDFPRRGDGRRGGRDRRSDDRGGERAERGGERPERSDRPERDGMRGGGGGGERRGGGGDRGERGAARGSRGGDRSFGDRNRIRRPRDPKEQTAPKVDDWNDFPSLSTA
ncbi:unnamed protein product [Medioppia subpectinata]|uniref:Hyaluronan/mRNA-binding protein domain-containing protein n=1 Tax=Medioppia subpectinata TaxID=1979941 RepID=A0A7R9PV03_9ACAR|nr:unnamed protein product [Medioppia subpectinata]CAG2101785.1 unnamed protein product [Medioppia subpectinata]